MRELKLRAFGPSFLGYAVAPSRVRELKQHLHQYVGFQGLVAPSRVRELKLELFFQPQFNQAGLSHPHGCVN